MVLRAPPRWSLQRVAVLATRDSDGDDSGDDDDEGHGSGADNDDDDDDDDDEANSRHRRAATYVTFPLAFRPVKACYLTRPGAPSPPPCVPSPLPSAAASASRKRAAPAPVIDSAKRAKLAKVDPEALALRLLGA